MNWYPVFNVNLNWFFQRVNGPQFHIQNGLGFDKLWAHPIQLTTHFPSQLPYRVEMKSKENNTKLSSIGEGKQNRKIEILQRNNEFSIWQEKDACRYSISSFSLLQHLNLVVCVLFRILIELLSFYGCLNWFQQCNNWLYYSEFGFWLWVFFPGCRASEGE